jgi:amino acid permease
VRYDDPRLLSTASHGDKKASPFVIIAEDSGYVGLASFFNVVVLVSV